MIVDTLAKVTWGGTISVEMPDKQTIQWPHRARGPPLREYPNLTQSSFLIFGINFSIFRRAGYVARCSRRFQSIVCHENINIC
jgi:hypothetical protein